MPNPVWLSIAADVQGLNVTFETPKIFDLDRQVYVPWVGLDDCWTEVGKLDGAGLNSYSAGLAVEWSGFMPWPGSLCGILRWDLFNSASLYPRV